MRSASVERIAILREDGIGYAAANRKRIDGRVFREAAKSRELRGERVAIDDRSEGGARFFFDAIHRVVGEGARGFAHEIRRLSFGRG